MFLRVLLIFGLWDELLFVGLCRTCSVSEGRLEGGFAGRFKGDLQVFSKNFCGFYGYLYVSFRSRIPKFYHGFLDRRLQSRAWNTDIYLVYRGLGFQCGTYLNLYAEI